MSTFNVRLKELRKSRHLSQRELADKLHISKSAVSMYEGGQREPDHGTLEMIADYFNVDMDYLLGRKDTVLRYLEVSPNNKRTGEYEDDVMRKISRLLVVKSDFRKLINTLCDLDDEDRELISKLVDRLSN